MGTKEERNWQKRGLEANGLGRGGGDKKGRQKEGSGGEEKRREIEIEKD